MRTSEERREYEVDVTYEVWRRDGDVDRISYDRLDDYYYDGYKPESAATLELSRQRPIAEEDIEQELQVEE